MPLPTPSDVHINSALTQIAIAFRQDFTEFVGFRVFPMVGVSKQSDAYYVWDRADFHRDEAKQVGPGAAAPVGGLRLSNDSYNCRVNKFAHLITEEEEANADQGVNPREEKTEDVVRKLMIRKEKDWAEKYFTTGVWTGSTSGADLVGGTDFTAWSTYASSEPIQNIRAQVTHMKKLGIKARDITFTCGQEVLSVLVDHPKFLERYEQVQPGILNEDLIAAVLGVGRVVVPGSVINTGVEGGTAAYSFIHGKSALLTYAPAVPSRGKPSAGYSFVWTGLVGGQNEGLRIKTFMRPELSSEQVQGESAWDHKVVSSACGVFFSNCVA